MRGGCVVTCGSHQTAIGPAAQSAGEDVSSSHGGLNGDRVEVSFPGHSLMRLELSVDTWELLWELRTSVQTMLYRNLNSPSDARTSQDGKLLSLIVELLNNTDSDHLHQGLSREDEVD